VVRYHKSESQWDKLKIVLCFLPPQLGQAMAVYMMYLQPFCEYLTLQVLRGSYSDYVWSDVQGAWEMDWLTRVLKQETGKRLRILLHTLDYWHTAIGIGRVNVGGVFGKGYKDKVGEVEEAEVDEGGEDVLELQNLRLTVMGIGNYSVLMDIVKHLSVCSMDLFRPLSMAWHRFLGVDGRSKVRQVAVVSRGHGARKRVLEESTSRLVAMLPQEKEARVEDLCKDSICKALQ
jgi:hypothetical protein